jgi:hypothetical protein
MAIKALFKRMMELDVTAYKNLKEISYQIRDGLNRSENQLSSDFLRMLKELEMILKKANQNDHFEFQRLRYFTQVEIAKNLNQTDEVERIKAEYKSFENDVTSIEDDREYRDEALTWIKGIGSINEFIRTSTIEIVRAWVISIEIYSLDSYIVEWIDKETTTIGEDEIPLIKQLAEEKRTARMERLKQIDEPLRLVDKNLGVLQTEKVSDVPRKEEPIVEALLKVPKEGWETKPIKSTIKPIKDVIKLEDGMTIRDLGNLKKNILKAKMANLKEEKEKKLKVAVYFEAENIESTRSDTTYLLKTFASIAQAKIEEISYNVKWGYEKRTLEGKADIRDMYGYDKAEVDGETIIKINEEEAQIVREIFAMYLNGYSSYKIAGELSRRNIKTKQGKKLWRSSTIAGIFTNVALIKT